MMEKPYQEQPIDTPAGLLIRYQFSRHASTWMADIEAYLVEQELSIELAPACAALIDTFECSLDYAVRSLRMALREFSPLETT